MAVTLRWLIEGSTLENLRCVACPELLERPVSSVNILDNPDVVKWFKKDELVLTSGYLLQDNADFQRRLLQELKDEGCAALGIKVHRYFQQIPPELIEQAKRIGFVLLELPFFYSFSDISKVVYNKLYAQSTLTARREQRLLSALTSLVFSNEPVAEMVRTVAVHFRRTALLVTREGAVTEQFSALPGSAPYPAALPGFRLPEDGARAAFALPGRVEWLRCVHLPGGHGALLLTEPEGAASLSGELPSLRRAASLLGLRLEQQAYSQLSVQLAPNSFFDTLVAGQQELRESEIVHLCEVHGFDYQRKRVCLTVFGAGTAMQDEAQRCALAVCAARPEGEAEPYVCAGGKMLCVFLLARPAVSDSELLALAKALAAQFEPALPGEATMAISRCHQSLGNIRGAYAECEQVYRLLHEAFPAKRLFCQLGGTPYRVLARLTPEELRQIYLDTIEPLDRFDRQNNGELCQTLAAFYRCQFNTAQTAQMLFVHRNTLHNRLDKIKELLQNDLQDADEMAALYLGLCVARLLG